MAYSSLITVSRLERTVKESGRDCRVRFRSDVQADNRRDRTYVTGHWRAIYLLMAAILLVLATVGIVLPGLPTTPFVLLASYLLARSSPRMHQALLSNRLFGPVLRDWQLHRAVKRQTKRHATLLICLAMFLLVFSGLPGPWIGLPIGLTLAGLFVVRRLPTIVPADSMGREGLARNSEYSLSDMLHTNARE